MFKTKKPSKVSANKKRPRCRRFYALVFSVILVFGLFNGFLVKNVFGANNYIDQIKWYEDTATHTYWFDFHVKTSFSLPFTTWGGHECALWEFSVSVHNSWGDTFLIPNCNPEDRYYFTAGQSYHLQFLYNVEGGAFNSTNYIDWIYVYDGGFIFQDTEAYYFSEFPSLTITYPNDNDEITGAFYIDGTYSTPLEDFNFLFINYKDEYGGVYNSSLIELATSTGSIHEKVVNLPAGNYTFIFEFKGNAGFYTLPVQIHLKIVNDIPPELPITGESPPEIPLYPITYPELYHANYCEYGTSTTPLFNTLTGAVKGIITSIGQNLASFSGSFNLTDAQDTGQQLASSVLIMRSYVSGINSFFGDFPISQILILYLVTFVLVILFRIIKNLVNLIKP